MNPLNEFPNLRKRLYRAHWVLVAAYGAWSAYIGATDATMPTWGVGVGAVLVYVGGVLSAQADMNVPGEVE